MRLVYTTTPIIENEGVFSIGLIVRDFQDNESEIVDELIIVWEKLINSDKWTEPEIQINNLIGDNAEHASKLLSTFARTISKGIKVHISDPCSVITELSRKNFPQVVFDKRVNKFVKTKSVKPGKDTQWALPEKFDLPIVVEATSENNAIKKVTQKFTELGMEKIENLDVMRMWFEENYPLHKLSSEDVPYVHHQKFYNAKNCLDISVIKECEEMEKYANANIEEEEEDEDEDEDEEIKKEQAVKETSEEVKEENNKNNKKKNKHKKMFVKN